MAGDIACVTQMKGLWYATMSKAITHRASSVTNLLLMLIATYTGHMLGHVIISLHNSVSVQPVSEQMHNSHTRSVSAWQRNTRQFWHMHILRCYAHKSSRDIAPHVPLLFYTVHVPLFAQLMFRVSVPATGIADALAVLMLCSKIVFGSSCRSPQC